MKLVFCFIITTAICLSCSDERVENSNPIVLEYKTLTNVPYGSDSNQTYDIYLPEGRDLNTKVMIFVHGGGWNSGDKSSMDYLINLYRTDFPDLALVNINYRLSDDSNPPYPMQIDDISTVVNQLKANREDYVISENYGFLGVSAGGHLSLLWSYAFDDQKNVKMICSIVGPTNFTDPAYLQNTDPLLQSFLDTYGINPTIAFLEEISPLHQVTNTAPPTILFYGGQDPLIPTSQGTDLRDRLNTLNVTNDFTLYPEAGHGWGVNPGELDLLLDTWNKIKSFTQSYF
ncbi:alpha/beta hydrolase [Aestuariivivens sediminis]|uniref:alpha/beta hydrolase n=1 Tax=Aestuariivivens sediminis TaxID=2913557 RepID=UPI001F56991C|nr:alpha/beta hydrolase [Aestuariivivens sediminis]